MMWKRMKVRLRPQNWDVISTERAQTAARYIRVDRVVEQEHGGFRAAVRRDHECMRGVCEAVVRKHAAVVYIVIGRFRRAGVHLL
jgi:hypothetical protein